MSNSYILYDLEVSVIGDPKTYNCSHKPGYAFSVLGENMTFIDNQQFSLYAMAALVPLLSAKQRPTDENDWMSFDEYVRCPDPKCSAQFEIKRTTKTSFQRPTKH
jgi:uncharacterized repeat protein (TIGR04076 family)